MITIPILFLIASLYSFYKGYKQWTSGSVITKVPRDGGPVIREESDKRVSWTSIGANVFGVILFVLAVGSFIIVQSER
jgi:hypothetical protein